MAVNSWRSIVPLSSTSNMPKAILTSCMQDAWDWGPTSPRLYLTGLLDIVKGSGYHTAVPEAIG